MRIFFKFLALNCQITLREPEKDRWVGKIECWNSPNKYLLNMWHYQALMNAGDTSVNEVDQVPAFFFFVKEWAGVKVGGKKTWFGKRREGQETDGRISAKKEWVQERDEKESYKPWSQAEKTSHLTYFVGSKIYVQLFSFQYKGNDNYFLVRII